MSIDRIGSATKTQTLLAQLRRAESALDESTRQVASGKVSSTYTGYGFKTATLEVARSKAAHAEADAQTASEVLNQLDLQDTQLSQLSTLANSVRETLTKAAGSGDASALMAQMQGYYEQAVQILNAKVGNTYLYGGDNGDTPPITPQTLGDLAALPSAASAFANGTASRVARVGDGQTVALGPLASDVATQLFTVFRDVEAFDEGVNGPFSSSMTTAQSNFLQGEISSAAGAADAVNAQAAANGTRYQTVQDVITQLQASATVYKTFASSIEDVDVAAAVTKLNQDQVALQAALQVSANINQLTLLNYL